MLHNSIETTIPGNKRFTMITHDWGAYLGLLYQNAYPDRVQKLVLIDVGIASRSNLPLKNQFISTAYQLWFALTFIFSKIFGHLIASLFMPIYFLPIFKFMHPTFDKSPVARNEIRPDKCYVYFQIWKDVLTGKVRPPKFPSCPTLFLYGLQKRCMFHDQEFITKLNNTAGCKQRAFDAGHWVQIAKPDEVIDEVDTFMRE
eukprot:TRINITY_DN1558_c0_g1_i9.p2 TRINITY_DN1558_c0_g1~~TRINITY_DN1558_c0_g1_i9.p2  ORF type:complete len:201 (+),score=34.07 TRINITY_DN1558_c0_g1_i9:160-762(+)